VTCQELVELVTEYLDGALPSADREAFEAHLALCPGCVTYVEQLHTAVRVAHDTRELERRPEVAALLHAFRDWKAATAG
jgi:anti-sigma factor RsiW